MKIGHLKPRVGVKEGRGGLEGDYGFNFEEKFYQGDPEARKPFSSYMFMVQEAFFFLQKQSELFLLPYPI